MTTHVVFASCAQSSESTRARRSALLKFSEVCDHIHPTKCRKYVSSLLNVIQDIIERVHPSINIYLLTI